MVSLIKNPILGEFLKYTLINLLPRDRQEACGEGEDFWCADYWTLEVAKCLYIGNERYMNDPLPRRLEGNKSFSKNEIVAASNVKRSMVKFLASFEGDNLLVCEVGRGLDILVAIISRQWNKIHCYDNNGLYGKNLEEFFSPYGYQDKIIFTAIPTHNFDVETIGEDTMMLINHTRVGIDAAIKFFECPKITYIIKDGKLTRIDYIIKDGKLTRKLGDW
ncbi:hypothetical protein LCGC14_1308000 [marine sediment metagenome]|uniref:Uncharacterized protein n=1 Tax=marine sediment metagenome TaxID=412755 RepID=A0A0F9L802_9ZZZZ